MLAYPRVELTAQEQRFLVAAHVGKADALITCDADERVGHQSSLPQRRRSYRRRSSSSHAATASSAMLTPCRAIAGAKVSSQIAASAGPPSRSRLNCGAPFAAAS